MFSFVDVTLDLEVSPANSVRFVPVYLGQKNCAVLQADSSYAFAFPPAAPAMQSTQTWQLSDRGTDGERFNMRDFTDDLEIHQASMLGANVYRRLTID